MLKALILSFGLFIGLSPIAWAQGFNNFYAQEGFVPDDEYYEDDGAYEEPPEDMPPLPPPDEPPPVAIPDGIPNPGMRGGRGGGSGGYTPPTPKSFPSGPSNFRGGGGGGGQPMLGKTSEVNFRLSNPPKFWKPKKRYIPPQYRRKLSETENK